MEDVLKVQPKHRPCLDPGFVPAVLWNQSYHRQVDANSQSQPFVFALERQDETVSIHTTRILPHEGANIALNRKYLERLLKFLLWQKGGIKVWISGDAEAAAMLNRIYSPSGERMFDYNFMGEKVYGVLMVFELLQTGDLPSEKECSIPLGRHLEGCRIGFDLGGSDRKCAAVVDGEVVFSEEVPWDPYFQEDPKYHFDGVNDSLNRAAAHLPRVDAIGGSAAGVYIDNEVRVASLFRGVSREAFESQVRHMFYDLKDIWHGVPFAVVNDGEVTALAGSMSFDDNAVLGISMGTSLAAGYVDPEGHIKPWLNELAFAPVDYRENAPRDEWSGDGGCGVQYFSQQGIGRLVPCAGIDLREDMPLPEKLEAVQKLMENGDARARKIYETIGVYFGYTIAHYADFYDFKNLLILGRVTSGKGGNTIIDKAHTVLRDEFPELADKIKVRTLDEKDKRHGQAIAAASLPAIHSRPVVPKAEANCDSLNSNATETAPPSR